MRLTKVLSWASGVIFFRAPLVIAFPIENVDHNNRGAVCWLAWAIVNSAWWRTHGKALPSCRPSTLSPTCFTPVLLALKPEWKPSSCTSCWPPRHPRNPGAQSSFSAGLPPRVKASRPPGLRSPQRGGPSRAREPCPAALRCFVHRSAAYRSPLRLRCVGSRVALDWDLPPLGRQSPGSRGRAPPRPRPGRKPVHTRSVAGELAPGPRLPAQLRGPARPRAQPFRLAWGYGFLPRIALRPRAVFAGEGHLDWLGYLLDTDRTRTAATEPFRRLPTHDKSHRSRSGAGAPSRSPSRPALPTTATTARTRSGRATATCSRRECSGYVRGMVGAIRRAGSAEVIDVKQDEGGVSGRGSPTSRAGSHKETIQQRPATKWPPAAHAVVALSLRPYSPAYQSYPSLVQ